MDEARVVMNLKEGVIELQGPVDFVRHYLDTYQAAIKELQGLSKDTVRSPQKAKALPQKRKGVPGNKAEKTARSSCTGSIRSYLEAGFFDEPCSTDEVKQRLNETGLTCADNAVRTSLRRLSLAGLLNRVAKGKSVRYQWRVQS